mmetsp:Transcript_21335/g.36570  ORF Transcript_21335/g.36570 Transcript_21335/m.36570 type:complete len:354 (-) Transcript_21335:11-1072(-)
MRTFAKVFACLACAGHGRRVQTPQGPLRSHSFIESKEPQSLAENGGSHIRSEDASSPNALVMLLAALNPAAAISNAGSAPGAARLQLQWQRGGQRGDARKPGSVVLPRVLEMRGGDNLIQIVSRGYLGVPEITRSWLTLMILCSVFNQAGLAPPELLALDAKAIVAQLQLWRPLTAMAFVGGVTAQLLQKGFGLVQMGRGLEMTLGFGEFARVLASCTAMFCLLSNVLGWGFICDGLIMAVTVLVCQLNPTAQTNMYGINIPFIYLPFAQMLLSYLFTQQIPWQDVVGALVGYVHYHINDNLKSDADIWRKQAKKQKQLRKEGGGGKKKGSSKRGGKKAKIATFADMDCGSGG